MEHQTLNMPVFASGSNAASVVSKLLPSKLSLHTLKSGQNSASACRRVPQGLIG
jgi:hypothetical protein